VFVIQIGSYT